MPAASQPNSPQSTSQPQESNTQQRRNSAPCYVNLSGYRFIELDYLPLLQADMLEALAEIGLKGTVLLANEGINVALSGTIEQVEAARQWFNQDERFSSLWFKESLSDIQPFSKLKVKIRREIITFQPNDEHRVSPAATPAPNITPLELKRWLDDNKPFQLLDTRNHYEVVSGTFSSAIDLNINTFKEFTAAIDQALEDGTVNHDTPMVTFCTGGIRCEKAAPYLLQNGFKEVYQIEGGILNYFEQCHGAHWEGDCFVFDDRVEVDPELQPTGARLCTQCHRAIDAGQQCECGSAD